ncbi:hypothetical protein JOS77_07555 [Chromobacterium haemolyticum]|nr:hypothetical protein JOS77_07555 [Chromobacterium haemolyticum]
MAGESGSIVFYNSVIAPYKGALEDWYVKNQNLRTYFVAIFVTILAVLVPNSSFAWRAFGNLPTPPDGLKKVLNYPS